MSEIYDFLGGVGFFTPVFSGFAVVCELSY